MDHARSGDSNVDHCFVFADAVERAGHERIVLDGIGKADKLRARKSTLIACALGGVFQDPADLAHHVHVDAGAGRGRIDRRAQAWVVDAKASGIESRNSLSERVAPFCTSAEYPPIKSTPTVPAASSIALAR